MNTVPRPTRIDPLLAVFAAEWRCARRSLLVWLAAVCAIAGGVVLYGRFSLLHADGYAPAPRFAMPSLGLLTLWIALLGVALGVPGLRARDEKAGLAEALDARPLSNMTVLLGRLFARVLPAWLSLFALGGLLHLSGWAGGAFDWRWAGAAPSAGALVAFLALDAPPTLLLWGALALLLATATRGPGIAAAMLCMLLALAGFALMHLPLALLPAFSGITGLGLPGSDILPRRPVAEDFAQRLALLALALGVLAGAATRLARRDDVPGRRLQAGALALVVLGAAGIAALAAQASAANASRRDWADAHLALRGVPRVDVQRIAGSVVIDPGRALTLDLRLDVRVPAALDGEPVRFSLNPGLVVSGATIAGEPVAHAFRRGLLAIAPRTVEAGAEFAVGIRASGRPDGRFAYPDTPAAALEESLASLPLALLGEQASLFEEGFVALMPGAHWLPRADVNFSASLADAGERDYRLIDLEVYAPPGWTVVGAGSDRSADAIRFRPLAPLAEFALIAAPWPRRTATIAGVACELLVHPAHAPQLQRLRPFAPALLGRYESTLRSLAMQRLPYEMGSRAGPVFSVVEAPASLRRYGGGAKMDAVNALPGVQLLPEHGLPTARLNAPTLEAQLRGLELRPDLGANGVPLYAGVWRNLVQFLTSATGEAAASLNLLVNALAAREFLTGGRVISGAADLGGRGVTALAALDRLFGAAAIEAPAADAAGAGFDALLREAEQLAAALDSALSGSGGAGALLSALRTRHGGGAFTAADFAAVLGETAPALAPIVRQWLAAGVLPGYRTSRVRVRRLPDSGRGEPRYQVRVHVYNGEPAPGVVRLMWRHRGGAFAQGSVTPVAAGAAVELGAVVVVPPVEVHVDTFLSRNRGAVRLGLPPVDVERMVDEEALSGVQPSAWRPRRDEDGIVVDDQDRAFSVVSVVTPGLRFTRQSITAIGPDVPVGTRTGGWNRVEHSVVLAWGRYRRSVVQIEPGDGASQATFAATLPAAGRWRLAYHLPGRSLTADSFLEVLAPNYPQRRFGVLDIAVLAAGQRLPAPLDATDALPGWNPVGTFELPAGEVRVVVSDRTSGDVVVADAIRWLPAEPALDRGPAG